MIAGLGANEIVEDWIEGVYFLPNILKTAIVVIHQLPENEDTLWLRVLGKGGTQKRAVEELTELPENNPFRENLLEILADWRKNLELRDNLSREEEEVINYELITGLFTTNRRLEARRKARRTTFVDNFSSGRAFW
ncbi:MULTISPECIES: hypothetical protein [Nostocales]|uniref:Uncharacterized protein n=1 Tax=Dolichospermum flos-aquae UHCC 0037 TaxID=2590026 RepID=A0ACC7S678_DOLFA|nr:MULTISPECIES: hypothetical protein [Nostocales]MBO1064703.1 hypothetical protein [Anabaena sp. 54]MTJ44058.1 hypothetical protein [Dolichospermum flos-aquae UHCC 0037]